MHAHMSFVECSTRRGGRTSLSKSTLPRQRLAWIPLGELCRYFQTKASQFTRGKFIQES